jgi:site-specific recombinase XerD
MRKAGIADVTFHNVPYTLVSRLVRVGADLPMVQALLGHKKIAMTLRYPYLSSAHEQRVVGKLVLDHVCL